MEDTPDQSVIKAIFNAEKQKSTVLNLRAPELLDLPVVVEDLARAIGISNYSIVCELMKRNIFVSQRQTIDSHIAEQLALERNCRIFLNDGTTKPEAKLRILPPEIGQCKDLEILILENNDLESLPNEINQCRKLKGLYLHGNTKLNLPPEVMGFTWREVIERQAQSSNAQAILDYYFARRIGGGRPLNEVKLVFVGRGGAGKTSLVDQLVRNRFQQGKRETPGVSLEEWKMQDCENGCVLAHIWDFAGQTIAHSMHQFFLSVRTVYILVLTGRENSEREDAEYWLRLIAAYGTDRDGEGPPVIVVFNKCDDRGSSRPKIDRRALQHRYPFIIDFVETDCKTRTGIKALRTILHRTVDRISWVRDIFPTEYRMVKDRLEEEEDSHLPYSSFRKICCDCGIVDTERQDALAENLHALGVALNFRKDERLHFASVLKPQWLTENVYGLMREAEKTAGFLLEDALPSILENESNPEMRQFLVDMMVRFELAFTISEENSVCRKWLVPQALPDSQPEEADALKNSVDATRLRYVYRALPASIVPRFIVRTNPLIEVDLRWASGVVLFLDEAKALIQADYVDRLIEITVVGPKDARRDLAGLIQRELRYINSQIKSLNPLEETEVSGEWVSVKALESDEALRRQTGIATEAGTITVDPVIELNEYSAPAARRDTWKPRVFISYSHANETQRRRLELYLRVLSTHGLVHEKWDDRRILPGADWDKTIKSELEAADVLLFLISTNALASEYIKDVEMQRALERYEAGDAKLILIILEDCDWRLPELAKIQVLPSEARPIRDWTPQDKGWKNVSDGLRSVLESLRNSRNGG